MVSASNPLSSNSLNGQAIARIVGWTCALGFMVDTIALTFPLGAGAAWRAGLMQQMSDRSIVLLIGIALLLYGIWESPALRKPLGFVSLSLGTLFLLLCMLVVRDSVLLQSQAVESIGTQATQLQTQVEQNRSDPSAAPNATPDDFAEALRQIDAQAASLKQNAKTSITKAGIASTSNFVVVSVGLLSLGRLGMGAGGGSRTRSVKKLRKQA
ncbi:HpsJ family protein [Leptolyngbya sp. CCNP1308]|uniref:HpsJ-like protein, cyanoexosortase C-associated n=1 Tax=Leptolyngbya sp. CCNP1308 TaxID=3110255 RepID=UPI002B2148C8|nr:HpsJ family protein [Leptolyngbya sp. CCNP1308]MEA5448606.1 HpsJ family protein [Leptolyngbya sp. CCNP1308]